MFVKVNNNNYWTEQAGKGSPLLLLHGFTGSTETWHSFIKEWSKHFRVIAIDLPGHGKTEVSSPYLMESVCGDIANILTQLGYDKVHILGYSMGGRTALSFAQLHPDKVLSVILESASPGLKTEQERKERMKSDAKLASFIEEKGIHAFVDYWENISLFESQKALPKGIQKQIRKERLQQKEKGLADSLRNMGTGSQASWWDKLDALLLPILLVVGGLDEKYVNINQEMVRQLKTAQLIIVENAGHAVHVEDSRKFGKIVSDFIKNEE